MSKSRMFQPAGPPEIVRSNQKDWYYLNYLRGSLADIFQSFAGAGAWIHWRHEIDITADFAYFALTTIAGYQTLGEEYCNVIQVDQSQRAIPSQIRRTLHILLNVCTPYFIEKGLLLLERNIQTLGTRLNFSESIKEILLQCIPVIRTCVTYTHRLHLALFYLKGIFYHISKRVTAIRYLLIRAGISNDQYRPSYRFLGWVTLIQLSLSLLYNVYTSVVKYKLTKNPKKAETTEEHDFAVSETEMSNPLNRCSLCLETRKNSTTTPCGHLFCWGCITEWCVARAECPLCREQCNLSRLVFLQHFDG
ncbi:peroxisome assembly protein 10-B-like [Glandiceps talaboti]